MKLDERRILGYVEYIKQVAEELAEKEAALKEKERRLGEQQRSINIAIDKLKKKGINI